MEWIDRMNQAMAYMEEHLCDGPDVAQAAKIACCSLFHFQRMFPYLAGMTLGEYIRRRKMTLAAFELIGGAKVLDTALKYGYESPTAFNRAFQSVHGIAPALAKKHAASLKTYSPIAFSITVKGEEVMNYRIEQKPEIRIVGIGTKEPMTMEDCFEKVPLFWEKAEKEGFLPRLWELSDGTEPSGILGVSFCDGGEFSGFTIAAATQKPCPPDMEEAIVPPGEWAIFECTGKMPETIQNLQQRILSEWLPSSGYEYAPSPDIEVYLTPDMNSPHCRAQVWLPIVKK